jgi:hypothetical protein
MGINYRSGGEVWCELPEGCNVQELKVVDGKILVRTENAVYDVSVKGQCALVGSVLMNAESASVN